MNELLNLLMDGRSRTIEMLASELNTSSEDILRKIDFLERAGLIRRVATSFSKDESLRTAGKNPVVAGAACSSHCSSCSGCSHGKDGKAACSSCMPEGGFKNMGFMWEVVK